MVVLIFSLWNGYIMKNARGTKKPLLRLDILRWLREKQCPWDEDCIHTALGNKNGEVLEWLHEEKCPWNEETHNILMKDCISNYKNQLA
jgi:hypothetical protein